MLRGGALPPALAFQRRPGRRTQPWLSAMGDDAGHAAGNRCAVTAHLTTWIAQHAILAVFVIMAVDAVLPAGGELTMLFAGAVASGAIGGSHVGLLGATVADGAPAWAVLVATGTLGYLAGSLAGWAIGRRGGMELIERRGRWLHLGGARFARAERWFDRFGSAFVFFGRLTPLVRSFVSIPAGVLGIRLGRYAVLTLLASLVWCLAFAAAGWALGGNWERVHHAFRYVDYAAIAAVVVLAATLLVRARAASPARGEAPGG
jgi:membrane protein DedA with SNARE-associated domain